MPYFLVFPSQALLGSTVLALLGSTVFDPGTAQAQELVSTVQEPTAAQELGLEPLV